MRISDWSSDVCSSDLEHVLLEAPTGSGKGVGIVIPNLLQWPDSVVVLDIKHENYEITAGFRRKGGQKVVLFNPTDREGRTARYNPLSYINRADPIQVLRSEERRVGKEWVSTVRVRWSRDHYKKKKNMNKKLHN